MSKLTEDELDQIKTFQKKYSEITIQIGQLELRKKILTDDLQKAQKNIDDTYKQYDITVDSESKFFQSLNKKYGEGSIDVDTGTFTPNPEK
jgi:hypothetical protein